MGLGLCWDKWLELGWFRVRVALGARVRVRVALGARVRVRVALDTRVRVRVALDTRVRLTGFRVGLRWLPPENYLAADNFLAVATQPPS